MKGLYKPKTSSFRDVVWMCLSIITVVAIFELIDSFGLDYFLWEGVPMWDHSVREEVLSLTTRRDWWPSK